MLVQPHVNVCSVITPFQWSVYDCNIHFMWKVNTEDFYSKIVIVILTEEVMSFIRNFSWFPWINIISNTGKVIDHVLKKRSYYMHTVIYIPYVTNQLGYQSVHDHNLYRGNSNKSQLTITLIIRSFMFMCCCGMCNNTDIGKVLYVTLVYNSSISDIGSTFCFCGVPCNKFLI
jgi:hypothetical protein